LQVLFVIRKGTFPFGVRGEESAFVLQIAKTKVSLRSEKSHGASTAFRTGVS
jgi:hypothetical protein